MRHTRDSLEELSYNKINDIKARAHQHALMLVNEIDTNLENRALKGETYYFLHIENDIDTHNSRIYGNKYNVGQSYMYDAIVDLYKESGLVSVNMSCVSSKNLIEFSWSRDKYIIEDEPETPRHIKYTYT